MTVRAADDDDTANESVTLSHTASGGDYGTVSGNVAVTVTDTDTAGLVFDPASVTVTEGESATYTVKLATEPSAAVTVTIGGESDGVTVDDTDGNTEGDQKTLTFTTDNWDTTQTVTVRAADDDDTANESVTLSHTASGGDYGSVTGNVAVTVTDTDTAGLVFDPASVTVTEGESATRSPSPRRSRSPSHSRRPTPCGSASPTRSPRRRHRRPAPSPSAWCPSCPS